MDVNASDNIINLFENQQTSTNDARVSHGPHKRGYCAYDVDDPDERKGREEWFRVHGDPNDLPNSVELFRYMDILKVYSPMHELLMIACQDATFQLKGRYLESIPELIQDRKLRALYLFNPLFHVMPDENEPIIHSLERVSMVDGAVEETHEE